jgi:hypothetical protein
MKKPSTNNDRSHRRALKAAKRKKIFAKKKYLWNKGIGLYDTEKERN